MTMTKTKTKADYTNLSRERNYWFQAILLCLVVGVAYFGNIYRTNNNSDGINAVVITEPSIAATTTASLIRGGDGGGGVDGGDGGQEDLSSTSVGDNSFESNTNSFVEEEEEGGLQIADCFKRYSCRKHRGEEKACKGQGGCFYYPHLFSNGEGDCSGCSGVSCGAHRSTECVNCPYYKGVNKRKNYCNGDCEWYDGDWWLFNAGCYDK
mmetsp:Transcript_28912/g.31112  ORF Transcript_28912/g.31112 Transcript_28912/m.31112 type:complete len:209 (-) Transcript_28912:35-661(-)